MKNVLIPATSSVVEDMPEVIHDEETGLKTGYMPLYRVIMWDDDVTTMEFVIRILVKIFVKDIKTAEGLTYEVHYSGSAHVDTLPLERAEFKVEQVHTAAKMEGYPFRCTIEPV